ncbi:type IV inositol polyphosphate 5-phosphatase 9-like [Phoenix dactylifera]|uniref:Type IV inositol polyphosphate 5-phosphatase 9-like n=1 Tax=Phoenix dactylifera TaxID=42345 RepID=A0A8B7MWA8_PHODC|nr:type IV inositol polyphosphate 5-phosphatase 9-like [Phoenix dactylifera]
MNSLPPPSTFFSIHAPLHPILHSPFLLLTSLSLPPPSPSVMQPDRKFGEVMWPKLVANKLLCWPLSSNHFATDFSATESLPDVNGLDHPTLPERPLNDHKGRLKYKVFVGTWNVGGVVPSDDLNLEDWLDTNNNSYDIYVLGFQEIVPLSVKNILGPQKCRIPMRWNSLIRTALRKSLTNQKRIQESKVGEKQKVHPAKDGSSRERTAQDFRCIISKQMVGILASVWVRGDLWQHVRHPSVSCVGCGIMGCLGNKGSVSVRFYLLETSFCFVCCHLASGGKEGDKVHRNSDAMDIFSRTSFPRGPSLNLPQKILDHDRIVLLGDLNYRISLPEAKTRSLVEQKEWNILLEKDQLRIEVSEGRVFEGWNEGVIAFSPTYKYYQNSDAYYGCAQGKKGEKRRAPAWCDRILWHGKGLKQKQYERCKSSLSDHRSVRAIFTAEVEVVRNFSSPRSLLSDTVDHIMEHLDLLSNNGLSNGRPTLQL